MSAFLKRLERAGSAAEDTLLVMLLTSMILLAAAQIIGRNLFNTTYFVGDEMLRIMVLWLTLAGALAASRADKHISISLFDRFLNGRWTSAVRSATHLFTAVVCGLIAWFSIDFVKMSHEFGDVLLGNVPAWTIQLVLPVGFGLMAYRHLVHSVAGLAAMFQDGKD